MPALGWTGQPCWRCRRSGRSFCCSIKVLHTCGPFELHAVVLENVKGILQKTSSGSGPSFMDSVLQEVRKALPDFDWQVAVLKAQDYKLGQQRSRIFIRGLRRVFGEVPDPLAPFGSTPLTAFLNPLLPGVASHAGHI